MRKISFLLILVSTTCVGYTQENMHPAPKQSTPFVIRNATIHTGTGKVLEGAYVTFENGKIQAVGIGNPAAFASAQVR